MGDYIKVLYINMPVSSLGVVLRQLPSLQFTLCKYSVSLIL